MSIVHLTLAAALNYFTFQCDVGMNGLALSLIPCSVGNVALDTPL